jgi:hypothetical protein
LKSALIVFKKKVFLLFLVLFILSMLILVMLRLYDNYRSEVCMKELASQYNVSATYLDVGKVIEAKLYNQLQIGLTRDEVNKVLGQFSPVYHGVRGNLSDGYAEIVTLQYCFPLGHGFDFFIAYSFQSTYNSIRLYSGD